MFTKTLMALFTVIVLAQVIFNRGPMGYDKWSAIFSSQWMKTLMAYIRAAPNADAIGNWTTENADHLQALQQRSEQTYGNLIAEIKKEMDAKPE